MKNALLVGGRVRKIIEFSLFTNDEKHGSNILLLHRTQIWLISKEKLPICDYLHWVFDLSCLVSSCFDSDDVKLISEHWNVTTNVLQ